MSAVTEADVAEAAPTLKARMQAKQRELANRTRQIPVPPLDVWGEDLVVEVKPVKLASETPDLKLITDATVRVLMRDDETGKLEELADGWKSIGELMDLDLATVTIGQIIKAVCGNSDEVVYTLAVEIVKFTSGRAPKIEQALGE